MQFGSNVVLEDEYWKLHSLGKPELRETSVLGFANPLPEALITSPTIHPTGNHLHINRRKSPIWKNTSWNTKHTRPILIKHAVQFDCSKTSIMSKVETCDFVRSFGWF